MGSNPVEVITNSFKRRFMAKKKLTKSELAALNRAWKRCIKMWTFIAKDLEKSDSDVYELKDQWAYEHDHDKLRAHHNCHFCAYAKSHILDDYNCKHSCPGKMVDPDFRCQGRRWDWRKKPVAFYERLLVLYGKWSKKQEKK